MRWEEYLDPDCEFVAEDGTTKVYVMPSGALAAAGFSDHADDVMVTRYPDLTAFRASVASHEPVSKLAAMSRLSSRGR